MKKRLSLLKHNSAAMVSVCICCCALIVTISAEELSPEERGLQIAREAWKRDTGYGDSASELNMVLRTSSGQEARRELRIRMLEVSESETRTTVVFDTPRDVRGTALLTHSYTDKEDDQWLYLPAAGRERRIAGGGRSGPFMGSEFSFEDMGSQRVENFTYKYIGEETLDETLCHVLERYPAESGSGYTRQVAWLDQEHLRVLKVDYYDRREELLKTLTISGYELHNEKFWRPASMEMKNVQNGRSTLLEWKNTSFDNGFTAREFEPTAMRSVR